jgi:tetratricopeptide (TPR) repeat protein
MGEIGEALFARVFHASEGTRHIWETMRPQLSDMRVEIVTPEPAGETVPWELLREPGANLPLVLEARSFVRVAASANAETIPTEEGPIRILLVICRPGGGDDVPFRSVASRLIRGLTKEARAKFRLDVLRPPTLDRLEQVISEAHAAGAPYHVVHFDGHGMYRDLHSTGNPRGYLLFENPAFAGNEEFIHGELLGQTLSRAGVAVFLLNACRSAHVEARAEPDKALADDKTEAFGSLAHEIVKAGVPGVVAMRYNVYVVTAAQFVADVYGRLVQGNTLGEAVSLGRKQLAEQSRREIGFAPRPLQDWCVPVVYEAMPLALFPLSAENVSVSTTLVQNPETEESKERLPSETLPSQPVSGFLGRDETLLALDRAFDNSRLVLLHAYAGSGKTATAVEFARWYEMTGGIENGRILFTSFEYHRPLTRVLNQLALEFQDKLERRGISWLALDETQRRSEALTLLFEVPVLWMWDNVEPIAGFPEGTVSAWTIEEQRELVEFLKDTQITKAKFLLTSRRDEQVWLGDLPTRISMPPMPMLERVQLARAFAERYDCEIVDVEAWQPLLQFTHGNPLTITVLVGQALRIGLKTKEQIEIFVTRLRAGETVFEDDTSQGRSKSLGASLAYGLAHAFDENERRQLALLHFFQGFVDVEALRFMGASGSDWCLPEARGLTRDTGIALLNRATEIGILTALGEGYYTIHPALPWFFKSLFDQYYAPRPAEGEWPNVRAARAYAEAMGSIGNYWHVQHSNGDPNAIVRLTSEEDNLLHAWQLAREHGWWSAVFYTIQGLNELYNNTSRAEWSQLLDKTIMDFVDPGTDGPLPGYEEYWSIITQYRVRWAMKAQHWEEALRLQHVCLQWDRQRAASALATPPEALDATQRDAIRDLASSLHDMGEIQRGLGMPECVTAYKESFWLSKKVGHRIQAASCALNLGKAYIVIPGLRDLTHAENWLQRSLELYNERKQRERAICMIELGTLAYYRFQEARAAKRSNEEVSRSLNIALQFYRQALNMIPSNAMENLAVLHNQLAVIHAEAGDFDRAIEHGREAIRNCEEVDDFYHAAETRINVALSLANGGRFVDALEYAHAALHGFEAYDCAEDIRSTQVLIAQIEQAMK